VRTAAAHHYGQDVGRERLQERVGDPLLLLLLQGRLLHEQ